MRILIVGNGGREHALLWKLRQDMPGATFYATRPNGGMAPFVEAVDIAPTDLEALSGFAAARQIDLTVVGPEIPLAMGIVDRFKKKGLPVFGPTKNAARIESSKAWAKDLMVKAGVPTAGYHIFTEEEAAVAHVREAGAPIVVKASGLAAGKGAVVCQTLAEAEEAIHAMLSDFSFGEAGREVVIEEFMTGEELSVFAITDGTEVVILPPAQDHKRVGEGDTGPNTGGMGAYAPVGLATPELMAQVEREILLPTLRAMEAAKSPFQGLLYAGLMLTPEGPKVVEYNCRFGDPETQVVLPLLKSSLLELIMAVVDREPLGDVPVAFNDGCALTTVVASAGYPGAYEKGKEIDLPGAVGQDGTLIFHAGTTVGPDGTLRSSGGRVLAVTGRGATVQAAAKASQLAAEGIAFEGRFFRSDIGYREIERQGEASE